MEEFTPASQRTILPPPPVVDVRAEIEAHYCRVIKNWTASTNSPTEPLKLSIISSVSPAAIKAWTTALTTLGYTVTTEGDVLVITESV